MPGFEEQALARDHAGTQQVKGTPQLRKPQFTCGSGLGPWLYDQTPFGLLVSLQSSLRSLVVAPLARLAPRLKMAPKSKGAIVNSKVVIFMQAYTALRPSCRKSR